MNAPHSGSISASEGRLATSTNRFVSAMACLSNDAILVASASTNPSSSKSGSGPIHVTVDLREVAIDIVCTQQHFQSSATTHQTRQSRHRTAAGY